MEYSPRVFRARLSAVKRTPNPPRNRAANIRHLPEKRLFSSSAHSRRNKSPSDAFDVFNP